MAVDFGKLNKAGLGATTFGARKTTGTSAQAAKNLQNSTAATKSTLFSFKRSPRTNWVPGQHVTKGQSQYNYQGMRASLNGAAGARRTYAPSFTGPVGNFGMPNVQVNNDMAKGMMVGQTIVAGMSLLNQLGGIIGGGDGVKSSSLGDKIGNALGSLGGGGGAAASAEANAAISGMQSQTTSDGLRQAISGAQEKLDSFDTTQIDNYEQNVGKLEGEIDGLEADVDKADDTVKARANDVSKANNAVASSTTKRDVAKQGLENALKNNKKCTSAYAEAKANLVSAQQTAAKTPQTIQVMGPDGKPQTIQNEPAYGNAQAALTKAEAAEQQAKQDLQMSEEEVNKMNESVASAEQNLKDTQDALTNAETEKTKADKNFNTANDILIDTKEKLAVKQKELEKLQAAKQDYDALKSEITKQEARLAKLEKEEQERAAELTSDISDKTKKVLDRKIDASDGMNISEKIRQKRNEKDNTKIEGMSQELDELRDRNAKTEILRDTANVIIGQGGEELREGTLPSGKKVYFVGTQEVSQAEYEALKPASA